MTIFSEQARVLTSELKDFDEKDFGRWHSKLHEVTIVGSQVITQYLEMKQKGMWKGGEFIIPNKGDSDGR